MEKFTQLLTGLGGALLLIFAVVASVMLNSTYIPDDTHRTHSIAVSVTTHILIQLWSTGT